MNSYNGFSLQLVTLTSHWPFVAVWHTIRWIVTVNDETKLPIIEINDPIPCHRGP